MSSVRRFVVALMLVCAMALVTGSCSLLDPYSYRPVGRVMNMYDSTVSVVVNMQGKFKPVGAGVVLQCKANRPKLILTAWHVVEAVKEYQREPIPLSTSDVGPDAPLPVAPETEMIMVGSKKDWSFTFTRVKAKMEKEDLALLEGVSPERNDCPAAEVAPVEPSLGETVWAIGTPMGKERNITRGVLSHKWINNSVQVYRHDAALFFGNSGGPLFNNEGQVVGINSFGEMFFFSVMPGGNNAIALPHIWSLVKPVLH